MVTPKLFSKITIRRGERNDLPDLSSSEFGFATDTGEVFIGAPDLPSLENKGRNEQNETFPYKNVQIITTTSEHTEILDYTYKSNSPFNAQTGVHPTLPVFRSYQQKFDDFLNFDDFVTDTTDVAPDLNRAIRENANLRKIINISSNDYIIDTPVKLAPNTTLKGEGIDHTFLIHTNADSINGPRYLFETIDSDFNEGIAIGTNGAELPNNIVIQDMTIVSPRAIDFFRLNRASNVIFKNVKFVTTFPGGSSIFYAFNISRLGVIIPISNIVVDGCTFVGVGNIFNPLLDPILDITVMNSNFGNPSNIVTINNDGCENFKFINNLVVGIDGDAIIATRGNNFLSSNNTFDIRNSDVTYSPIRISNNFQSGQSIHDKFYLNSGAVGLRNSSITTVYIPSNDEDMIFNGIEKSGRNAFQILGEQTNTTIPMYFNLLEYSSVRFTISVKRSGTLLYGTIDIVSDGTNAFIIDNTNGIIPSAVTFGVGVTPINGSNSMHLIYTTPDAGVGVMICTYEAIRS